MLSFALLLTYPSLLPPWPHTSSSDNHVLHSSLILDPILMDCQYQLPAVDGMCSQTHSQKAVSLGVFALTYCPNAHQPAQLHSQENGSSWVLFLSLINSCSLKKIPMSVLRKMHVTRKSGYSKARDYIYMQEDISSFWNFELCFSMIDVSIETSPNSYRSSTTRVNFNWLKIAACQKGST